NRARSVAGVGISNRRLCGHEAVTRSGAPLRSLISAFVSRQAFWEQPRNDDAAAVRSSQPRLLTVAAYVSGSPIPRLRPVLPHKWGRVVPSPPSAGTSP